MHNVGIRFLFFVLLMLIGSGTYAQIITTVAGDGIPGEPTAGIAATNTHISHTPIRINKFNEVFLITDTLRGVKKIDRNGIVKNIFRGTYGFSGDGGPATLAKFSRIGDFNLDKFGNIYLCDATNYRIRKVDTSGIVNTVVGKNSAPYTYVEGAAATTEYIGSPEWVVLDSNNCIYFTYLGYSGLRNSVRKVDTIGITTTCAGSISGALSGSTADSIPATSARINAPLRLAVNRQNQLFFLTSDMKIYKLSQSDTLSIYAGTGTRGYTGDGGNAKLAMIYPSYLAFDNCGNLYFPQASDHVIRKIDTSGIISTICGTGSPGFSGDGGPASAATLHNPAGIDVDCVGNIYIADDSNFRIRKIIYPNKTPKFTLGNSVSIAFCHDTGPYDLNTTLAVRDSDCGQELTWAQLNTPAHGVANVAYLTNTNTRVVTPTGLNYTANPGFTGIDSFSVVISDCGGLSDTISIKVKVDTDAYVGVITGPPTLCLGDSSLLNAASSGGSWYSYNPTIGNINAATGMVTCIDTGTATLVDIISNTCGIDSGNYVLNIIGNPDPGTISGPTSLCDGATASYSETVPGGVWSTALGNATIDAAGVVTGVHAGTDTVVYTVTGACANASAHYPIVINPLPGAITGTMQVCASGGNTSLTDTSVGGNWSSASATIATVSAGGVLTGVNAGTTTITYSFPLTGCYTTTSVLVNPLPTAISGVSAVCTGLTATYSDTGSGAWSVSPTSLATIDNTTGVLNALSAGTANITYTAPTGCITTRSITLNATPPAIAGPASTCAGGATISLTDALPGGGWAASPSSVATISSSGTVTGVGIGTASVTYTVSGCSTVTSISVQNTPTSIITPLGDTDLCPGDAVVLTGSTGTGYNYQWYLGATPLSGATDNFYVASAAGAYKLYISLAAGCGNMSAPVGVSVAPATASLTASGTTAICSGTSVMLTASTGTGYTYEWLHNGVGIAGAGAAYLAATDSGNYQVMISNGSGCYATSAPVSVTLLPTPDGTFSVSPRAEFCIGDSAVLSVASGLGYSYRWSNSGASISGATSNRFVARAAGYYAATITNSYSCSTTSPVLHVITDTIPSANITVTGTGVVCAGGAVTLTANTTNAGYYWYKDGAIIAGATSRAYRAVSNGSYAVKVTTAAGCTSLTTPAVAAVFVGDVHTLPYSSAQFCWGGNALLGTDMPSYTGTTYQWQRSMVNIAGATNSTYRTYVPGSFNCVLTLPAGCSLSSLPTLVAQYPVPNPTIVPVGTQLTTQRNFVGYQWFENMVPLARATTWRMAPAGTGDYTVKVIDSNGCETISPIFTLRTRLEPVTGIETLTADDIKLFPNPVTADLFIDAPEPVIVSLSALDGRVLIPQQTTQQLSLTPLANGTYIVQCYSATGKLIKVQRVVKE